MCTDTSQTDMSCHMNIRSTKKKKKTYHFVSGVEVASFDVMRFLVVRVVFVCGFLVVLKWYELGIRVVCVLYLAVLSGMFSVLCVFSVNTTLISSHKHAH